MPRQPDASGSIGRDGTLNADVSAVAGGGLKGWLDWPGDALFRPVVGVFQGGALVAAAPTRRVWMSRPGETPRYVCAFEVKGEASSRPVTGDRPTLTCLELGMPIGDRPYSGAGVVGIDDIIRLGQTAARPWRVSGFHAFLRLSLHDQLTLAYLDLLGRRPTDEEVYAAFRRLLRGKTTILDLRDDLLSTKAFTERSGLSVDRTLGAWCVWEGLGEIEGLLVAPGPGRQPLSPLSFYLEIVAAQEAIASHLARLALGRGATDGEREAWRRRNEAAIAAAIEGVPTARPGANAAPAPAAMIRDWLPDMAVGSAGERTDLGVRRRPGASGGIVYGPYEPLRSGAYRLAVALRSPGTPIAPARPLHLAIEVSSRRLRFARVKLTMPTGESERIQGVDFHVTPAFAGLVRNARFEARVAAHGGGDLELRSVTLTYLGDERAPASTTVPDWYARLWMFGAERVKRLIDRSRRARSARG